MTGSAVRADRFIKTPTVPEGDARGRTGRVLLRPETQRILGPIFFHFLFNFFWSRFAPVFASLSFRSRTAPRRGPKIFRAFGTPELVRFSTHVEAILDNF